MKIMKITALLLLTVMLFSSCNINIVVPGIVQKPSDNTQIPPTTDTAPPADATPTPPSGAWEDYPPDYNNDDITFDIGEQVMIVVESEISEYAYKAQQMVSNITDVSAITVTDDYKQSPNELVLGNCNRQVSVDAYKYLENIEKENSFVARFAFYAHENSIGIAFDRIPGYDQFVIETAINTFKQIFVTAGTALDLDAGELYAGSVDIMEYQASRDEERKENAFYEFERVAGAEALAVLKEMYDANYSSRLVNWLAGLYDPKTGGFYYSNSARDNETISYGGGVYQLLPDIESTAQALGFIESSGLIYEFRNIKEALPKQMQDELVKFIKEKQDENGYFYHPQWTKSMVDNQLARRGRDLNSAIGILNRFGAKPTYDTITGTKGDGLLYDGTPASNTALTSPIKTSVASAVSHVLKTAAGIPSHLKDEASFRAYLAGFENPSGSKYILRDSYWIGNQLAAQAAEIKGRDKELISSGASYTLSGILEEWLNSYCQEETGTWSNKYNTETGKWNKNTIYDALNGLMKISSAYQALELALPYPIASVKTAMETITTTDPNTTVCFAYNSWVTICNIMNNVSKHKSVAEADKIITDIKAALRADAPELIRKTLEKQAIFRCDDGSFSYTVASSSETSQGLPVAISGTKEGDVNATVICTTGTLSHMFDALGYPKAPILYRTDFNKMLMIIEENREK